MEEIAELRSQLQTARLEIKNLRDKMNNFTRGHKKELEKIKNDINTWSCQSCKNLKSKPESSTESSDFALKYIGIIRTSFPSKKGTPRQPIIVSEAKGQIILTSTLFTNNKHSLEGLEKFSHMWIIFHFHETQPVSHAKVAPPRLDGLRVGVFSSRSPHRPNPIGLSLVRIGDISDSTIDFYGVDMIDGTAVLDIKPYIPCYDNPSMIEEKLSESCDVFVPDWINNKKNINVIYTDEAAAQAEKLAYDVNSISEILKADPRSVYKRKRYGDDNFGLSVLGYDVICKFMDDGNTCLVTDIQKVN